MKTQLDQYLSSDVDREMDSIETSIPGFRLFMNDRGKARPFERKIKKVENLRYGDYCYYTTTLKTQTVPSNTQQWRRFANVKRIEILPVDQYIKDGWDFLLDPTMNTTHILRREYLPLIITDHCMLQYGKRMGNSHIGLINNDYTLQTIWNMSEEFWIRGAPVSPDCGIKTEGGILLGQWLKPDDIGDDFELLDPFHIHWNHKRGHKNQDQFSRYTKFIPNIPQESYFVFFAKTFITDQQAGVDQLLQAKAYINNDQSIQRFRREGHKEVWLNQ